MQPELVSSRRAWAVQAAASVRPRMPQSLEAVLRQVNAMTWQQVFGLKGAGPREKTYRMGVFTVDGPARHEQAELVRLASGSWLWAAWLLVPEIGFAVRLGGSEPNRKIASGAAEKAFRRLCELAWSRALRTAMELRGVDTREH